MSNVVSYWRSSALTHVGLVRQLNEDSFLESPEIGLWAVADGMGGHHSGDVASASIIRALSEIKARDKMSDFVNEIEDKLINVNDRLREMAAEFEDNRTIGSTIIAMVANEKHCAFLWAGDSRAYRVRDGLVSQVTRDHSQVEEMVERGLLPREDAETHPASNVITRAVGASDVLYVDVDLNELKSGDSYMLCSDGLYKHVENHEIELILDSEDSAPEAAQKLVNLTLERGATDNVTVVVIQID